MASDPYSRPQELSESDSEMWDYRRLQPRHSLVCKYARFPIQKDKDLLDSGYMSDCTVICRDVKWATHKAILCSRNKWFRVALDGPFQEASTGVVTIEDTDPDAVQVVLEYIYTGRIYCYSSTPAKIVEIWKAGDFFDIRDVVEAAQKGLARRLETSAKFFNRHFWKAFRTKNVCTKSIQVKYARCGHYVREDRACPVDNVRPQTVFHLCEPERTAWREGLCTYCNMSIPYSALLFRSLFKCAPSQQPEEDPSGASSIRPGTPYKAPSQPTPPDDELRGMIEEEIRVLCDALVIATADTPQGSQMQKALIKHMCNTRVAAWDGFTVCRFLEC